MIKPIAKENAFCKDNFIFDEKVYTAGALGPTGLEA